RALLRRGVFKKRAKYLHRKIARKKICENFLFFRFILVGCSRTCVGRLFEHRRNDLLRGRNLGDHRSEAREEQGADVEGALVEKRNYFLGDHVSLLESDRAHAAQFDRLDDQLAVEPAKLVVALAADTKDFDLFALRRQRISLLTRKAHDR